MLYKYFSPNLTHVTPYLVKLMFKIVTFIDDERPLTWFSRSRHSLTLNISQTATDTAIVTINQIS